MPHCEYGGLRIWINPNSAGIPTILDYTIADIVALQEEEEESEDEQQQQQNQENSSDNDDLPPTPFATHSQ